MKGFLFAAGIIAAALVVFLIIAGSGSSGDVDPVAKIDKACRSEYGADPEAVTRCKIALDTEMLDRDMKEREDRARSAAGLR
jgi:hypothetical protein